MAATVWQIIGVIIDGSTEANRAIKETTMRQYFPYHNKGDYYKVKFMVPSYILTTGKQMVCALLGERLEAK
jgi:hypothetical protein